MVSSMQPYFNACFQDLSGERICEGEIGHNEQMRRNDGFVGFSQDHRFDFHVNGIG